MTRMTTSAQLKTLIVKLGGVPKGQTVSELVDELEDIINLTAGGTMTDSEFEGMMGRYVETHDAALTDEDFDEIFGA